MAKIDPSSFTGRLQEYVERVTERSPHGSGYVCPLCGSGTGPNKTGAFSLYKKNGVDRWQCFSCGKMGDLFDLIGEVEGVQGYPAQLAKAQEIFGISAFPARSAYQNHYKNERKADMGKDIHTAALSYAAYFLQANQRLPETDYHRGISLDTLNKYQVGYDPQWRIPLEVYLAGDKKTKNGKPRTKEVWQHIPTTPRLIIPTSDGSYLARDTRSDVPDDQKPYVKSKVGKVHIFNADVLFTQEQPVFVAEGELDALSIIDCGGEACALGSANNAKKLVDLLSEKQLAAKAVIIALDDDDEGHTASEYLEREFFQRNIPFTIMDPIPGFKDWNECLMKERGFLEGAVITELEKLRTQEEEERDAYIHSSAADFIQPLYDRINASIDTPSLSTGFPLLDAKLDGGLYEGLYILGAISSLGKTTFMLQLMDQLVQGGEAQALFFSLEMSRYELMAKSISRHTADISAAKYDGSLEYAKTVRGITTGRIWNGYSEDHKKVIYEAVDIYGSYAHNIFIQEGLGDIGVKQIREGIEKHIKMTGRKPVVFIDYLQILAPYSDRMSDKQIVDKNVLELKKISRDYKIPVFTVSSFNRMSYGAEAKMEAFKESGGIEYSSDVLFGLHLAGAGEKTFDATKEKAKLPREVELVILKNRNGAVGKTIRYLYDPRFNTYQEQEEVLDVDYTGITVHGEKPVTPWDNAPEKKDELLTPTQPPQVGRKRRRRKAMTISRMDLD